MREEKLHNYYHLWTLKTVQCMHWNVTRSHNNYFWWQWIKVKTSCTWYKNVLLSRADRITSFPIIITINVFLSKKKDTINNNKKRRNFPRVRAVNVSVYVCLKFWWACLTLRIQSCPSLVCFLRLFHLPLEWTLGKKKFVFDFCSRTFHFGAFLQKLTGRLITGH